jgi:hypothetical protein
LRINLGAYINLETYRWGSRRVQELRDVLKGSHVVVGDDVVVVVDGRQSNALKFATGRRKKRTREQILNEGRELKCGLAPLRATVVAGI